MRHTCSSLLLGSVSLLAFVVFQPVPAFAQETEGTITQTRFSVTIAAVNLTLRGNGIIALGTIPAGQAVNSSPDTGPPNARVPGTPPEIQITNGSSVALTLLIAGTNSLQATPLENPSWELSVMETGTDKFRWGFDQANPPNGAAFTFLAGPGCCDPAQGNGAVGTLVVLPGDLPAGGSRNIGWRFEPPTFTSASRSGANSFDISIGVIP